MLKPNLSFAAVFVLTPFLVAHCGGDSDGGDDDKGEGAKAGEGGEATGGSSGTTSTGGRSGAGNGGTAGDARAGSGGTAARGGGSGDAGAPQGGQGDGGQSGAGDGGTGMAGEGGLGGEGGDDSGPTCEDPTGGGACTGDLSMIGTGDFEVKFTITTSTTAISAIVQQRAICDHSYFWDARLLNGAVFFEVDDANANYAFCQSPVALNDGLPHRVVVRRVAGSLSIVVDCSAPTSCPSATNLSTTLAPLGNHTNNPCIGSADGTTTLDGTVTDVCVRAL